MLRQGIIEPIQFSSWATPIVPVVKADGKSLRICGDYRLTINKVSELDPYPIPRIEDLYSQLSGGKVFSKLDLSQAYLQMLVDDESKKYTVINTHRGLFIYNRLPFGIKSSPAIFERAMESLLQGLPHVCVYLDDILVTGESEAEHLQNLREVLSRLVKAGIRLKKSKCHFFEHSITYLGHKIDSQGLHPTEDKIKAVKNAPTPQNVTQLRLFLGLVNYYGKFLPNLATHLAPLHTLLSNKVQWHWSKTCESAFNTVKSMLHSDKVLVHYDPQKTLILTADASPYGVGAILSHIMPDGSEKPVSFASRTLSSAEKKYFFGSTFRCQEISPISIWQTFLNCNRS